MARSLLSTINQLSREMQRSARAVERERQLEIRLSVKELRVQNQHLKQTEKLRLIQKTENRITFAEAKNNELQKQVFELESLLINSLNFNANVDFKRLLQSPIVPKIELGNLTTPEISPHIPKPTIATPFWIVSWLPFIKKKYQLLNETATTEYDNKFHQLTLEHRKRQAIRLSEIDKIKKNHENLLLIENLRVSHFNKAVIEWQEKYLSGDPEAIADYCSRVLIDSKYPEGFATECNCIYNRDSKLLALNFSLPNISSIIPQAKSFKYVKSTDSINQTDLPKSQRKAIYTSTIAQTTLRAIYEIFSTDELNYIDTVVFSGYVSSIDPATGRDIRPCIVSLRTTKDELEKADLKKANPIECLKFLKASFSKDPAELAPVRPMLELNMNDPRFIQETDVLSELNQHLNLMDLTPSEFETLITNLFQEMGLITKLTQASRDGGVDCVAFDPRPIFGGKVVIQAKRYRSTVGVSAVRDLFGTMQNEGASKGILITTSGYGKASFDFANGKPIELLDGGNLLYLLKEHAKFDARILMPEKWDGF